MKKTVTLEIQFPVIVKDELTEKPVSLDYKVREFGMPDCVMFEWDFEQEVQRYIDIAYADFFQWNSDRLYAAFQKKSVPNEWEKFSDFANEIRPSNTEVHCSFAFMYAFCIDKHVQTHYYRDGKGKFIKQGVTIGEYGTELFELFKDYAFGTVNDKTLSIARQQLRAWFGDVIANDSTCKEWDTKKINIDSTRQLVNYAGNVITRMRRDFSNKSTTISAFTEQALLKCFQRCFKMKLAPVETEHTYVVK